VEILCTSTELGLDLCDNVVGEKKRVDLYESKRRNPGFGCFQKWGENPKMDGENHGKAYFLMDDLGRKPTISIYTPEDPMVPHHRNDAKRDKHTYCEGLP